MDMYQLFWAIYTLAVLLIAVIPYYLLPRSFRNISVVCVLALLAIALVVPFTVSNDVLNKQYAPAVWVALMESMANNKELAKPPVRLIIIVEFFAILFLLGFSFAKRRLRKA